MRSALLLWGGGCPLWLDEYIMRSDPIMTKNGNLIHIHLNISFNNSDGIEFAA